MIDKKDILSLKTRRDIFRYIDKNPGLNLRDLSRKLDMPRSTLNYHINYLKKHELIEIKIEGQYRYIFSKEKIGTNDKKIMHLLRKKTPSLIFIYFLYKIYFSQKELCEELKISSSTANYHIKKFLELGIFQETIIDDGRVYPFTKEESLDISFKRKKIGREVIYIRKNQEIINDSYRLLITYKDSMPNKDLIDTYIEYYDGVLNFRCFLKNLGLTPGKKRLSTDEMFDLILEFIKPPFAY